MRICKNTLGWKVLPSFIVLIKMNFLLESFETLFSIFPQCVFYQCLCSFVGVGCVIMSNNQTAEVSSDC